MTAFQSPLIDTHAHVFTRTLPFAPGSPHRFDRDYPTEDYIKTLRGNGVRFGVLAAPSFLGNHDRYALEALAAHPNLRATMAADPTISTDKLRIWEAAGVTGLRLSVGNLPELPDLTSHEFKTLFRRVRDVDWHIHLYAKPEHTPQIIDTLLAAEVTLVIDHFGARGATCGIGSTVFDAVLRALSTGRAWVKLSAPYWSTPLRHAELARRFKSEAGAEHLLWGSDWPFTKLDGKLDYRTAIAWLNEWIPEPADRAKMDQAASALYRITL